MSSGGKQSWGIVPGRQPVGGCAGCDLPFRMSVSANSEFKRFFNASERRYRPADLLGPSQYVDPTNDQAFSPYFAITPRFTYLPTFSDQTEAAAGLQSRLQQALQFRRRLPPVAIGRRHVGRDRVVLRPHGLRPEPPSPASAVVGRALPYSLGRRGSFSENWNASFAVELLGRWYEADRFGETSRDWEALPIATARIFVPASYSGATGPPTFSAGRPSTCRALICNVWSTVPGVSYGQWEASATLKLGWRF